MQDHDARVGPAQRLTGAEARALRERVWSLIDDEIWPQLRHLRAAPERATEPLDEEQVGALWRLADTLDAAGFELLALSEEFQAGAARLYGTA